MQERAGDLRSFAREFYVTDQRDSRNAVPGYLMLGSRRFFGGGCCRAYVLYVRVLYRTRQEKKVS